MSKKEGGRAEAMSGGRGGAEDKVRGGQSSE